MAIIILLNTLPAFAALVSLEGSQPQSMERETAVSGNVLISKENKTPDINYVVRKELDQNSKVLISYENTEFNGTFILRQSTEQKNNALADRPDLLDMKILTIIEKENIKSIEEYALWLKKNFEYRKDENGDIWAQPQETLAKQFGDCEDFAFLNAAALRVFGYKPTVFGLGGGIRTTGHAICAFKKNGKYLVFDNNNLKTTSATTQETLSSHLIQNSGYAYMFEVNQDMKIKNALSQEVK